MVVSMAQCVGSFRPGTRVASLPLQPDSNPPLSRGFQKRLESVGCIFPVGDSAVQHDGDEAEGVGDEEDRPVPEEGAELHDGGQY